MPPAMKMDLQSSQRCGIVGPTQGGVAGTKSDGFSTARVSERMIAAVFSNVVGGPDRIEGARQNRHFSLVPHDPKRSQYENPEAKVPTGRDKMARIERKPRLNSPMTVKEVRIA